ncbi:hypothetical protein KBY27_10175 [Ruegeria pomeroyi]|uniref:Uncharacterized protein n=1 Tax=Ruegeria pomeroyi TaxID=89184 RepID=A0A9Q3ZNA7_9RHOB|nr:hypothetical protein [Ruegeria pomeroyi]MCE8537826.1 hypothetical protein [Ruegeria pomeroyi]
MPLEILLILVIGGISAIAIVLHLTGRSERAILRPETLQAAWLRHFPEDHVMGTLLAHDCHAALVETQSGPGLIWALGADTVGRHLRDYEIDEVSGGLTITFHDFTAPRVTLKLDPDETPIWQQRLARA